MTDQVEVSSIAVAKAIDRVVLRLLRENSSNKILVDFKLLEDSLAGTSSPGVYLTESRRRVAESKISLLSGADTPASVFMTEWVSLEQLGFSSLEREANAVYWLCRFFTGQTEHEKEKSTAFARLRGLVQRLRDASFSREADHYEKSLAKLIDTH